MRKFRLIRTHPETGVYNMALDEKIFNRYLEDGIPVFRLYRWKAPSFTYGVSQQPGREIDSKRCISDGVEVVKRITGGGILFHHDEITYSFVCDKRDVGEPQEVLVSYKRICAFLIRFYESLGLQANFALESAGFQDRCVPHELCSASYEKYDIVINGRKIGGNAQKRRRRVIFQHGSIPCSIDWGYARRYLKSLPEDISLSVTALGEELAAVPDKVKLEEKLIDAFACSFGACFMQEKESLYEAALAG
ncbi:MAG: lipoate--protein ligase family protein [Candidatus Omnitrophota bacterium]